MLIPSFRALRTVRSLEEVRTLVANTVGITDSPITSWQKNALPMLLVQAVARLGHDVFGSVAAYADGGYGETAAAMKDERWLDTWVEDRFGGASGLKREKERFAVGVWRGRDTSGSGQSIGAGALIAGPDDGSGVSFTTTASVTIPPNGTAPLPVIATTAGSRFNIPSNTPLRLVTDFPGLEVTNPPQAGTQTWITSSGADRESNASLYGRSRLHWHELSIATPAGYYASKLRKQVPTITKVRIDEENPRGPFTVDVICATGAGPASGADIVDSQSYLRTIRSVGGDLPMARAAVARALSLAGVAYVQAPKLASARGGVATDLSELQRDLPMGGTVYAAELIKIVQSKAGVRNFVPDGGLSDVVLGVDEVATLLHEIRYVAE